MYCKGLDIYITYLKATTLEDTKTEAITIVPKRLNDILSGILKLAEPEQNDDSILQIFRSQLASIQTPDKSQIN